MQVIDYDDYFEDYMGLVYFNIIDKFKLNVNTVLEFAPGFRYKIAYALKRINFKGTLYIIDSNKNVANFVQEKYKTILPDANIIVIDKDLNESINILPNNIDLFVANHSVDDMIISKYLDGKNLENAFNNTEKSKDLLISVWNNLNEDDNTLFKLQDTVYNDLLNFFKKINFKFIIMSQYKSAYYRNQNNYVESLSKIIFDKLKTQIEIDNNILKDALSFDFEDFDAALMAGFSLKENIQYYENWIAGKLK